MTIWHDLLGLEFEVKHVDAKGIKTRALIAGEGEDVIMMHGTSGHMEAFTRNIRSHVEAGFKCHSIDCLLYTSPSPRDKRQSRMPSSA